MLGLKPHEFKQLTVTEFNAMAEARMTYLQDRDRQWRGFFAAMTANIMNATGNTSTPIQPADLLGSDDRAHMLKLQADELAKQKKRP